LKSYIQRDTYRILQHQITTTPELSSALYKKLQDNISEFRKIVDRPLKLSETILTGHLVDLEIKSEAQPEPGKILLLL
jgi:aconitate hydratase